MTGSVLYFEQLFNYMPKAPNKKKLNEILTSLKQYPKGIWLRALSRELRMPISSLHYRLHKYFADKIVFEKIEYHGVKGQYVLIKLKNARKRK